jgi:hypothetical protein
MPIFNKESAKHELDRWMRPDAHRYRYRILLETSGISS